MIEFAKQIADKWNISPALSEMASVPGPDSNAGRPVPPGPQRTVDGLPGRRRSCRRRRFCRAGSGHRNVCRPGMAIGCAPAFRRTSPLDVEVFSASVFGRGAPADRRPRHGDGRSQRVGRTGGGLGELAAAARGL